MNAHVPIVFLEMDVLFCIIIALIIVCVLVSFFGFMSYFSYISINPEARIKLSDKDPNHKNKTYRRQDLSVHELAKYDGNHEESGNCIFIAIDGCIYDVSKDKKLFGPGGHYNILAGRDASRSFAKFSLSSDNVSMNEDLLSDLTLDEEWKKQYSERYQCVGKLIRGSEDRNIYDITDDEDDKYLLEESEDHVNEDIDEFCGIQNKIPSFSVNTFSEDDARENELYQASGISSVEENELRRRRRRNVKNKIKSNSLSSSTNVEDAPSQRVGGDNQKHDCVVREME